MQHISVKGVVVYVHSYYSNLFCACSDPCRKLGWNIDGGKYNEFGEIMFKNYEAVCKGRITSNVAPEADRLLNAAIVPL